MLQLVPLKYLTFLIVIPFVKARSHKYSRASSTSVRYTDVNAYYENTSNVQCLALCEGEDSCASVNYNQQRETCELTPHVPRIQVPVPATETNWRVYYNDRYISAVDAWQKSTYIHLNSPLSASIAIDGNRDNNDVGVNINCASTNAGYNYWATEFAYVAEVDYVIIFFRNLDSINDRNQNLRLLISSTREDCDNNNGTDCATYPGPPASPSQSVKVKCTQPVSGKFLKIIQNIQTYLSLCEVEVYHV